MGSTLRRPSFFDEFDFLLSFIFDAGTAAGAEWVKNAVIDESRTAMVWVNFPGFIACRTAAGLKLVYLGIGPRNRFGRNLAQNSALRQRAARFFDEIFFLRQEGRFLADIEEFSSAALVAGGGENDAVVGRDRGLVQLLRRQRLENLQRFLRIAGGVRSEEHTSEL